MRSIPSIISGGVVLLLGGCGRKTDDHAAPSAAPAGSSAVTTAPKGNDKLWPTSACTILGPDVVGGVLGKPVKPREQYAICDYIPETGHGISVHYYNFKNGATEFPIFKGLQKTKKHEAIAGLGVEAIDGNSGTGAGLGVQRADGRSFMVADGTKDQRIAVAKLVLAIP